MILVPRRNSTRAMLPSRSFAEARNRTAEPGRNVEPLAGVIQKATGARFVLDGPSRMLTVACAGDPISKHSGGNGRTAAHGGGTKLRITVSVPSTRLSARGTILTNA